MSTEKTEKKPRPPHEIFYDAECAFCAGGMRKLSPFFARRGFCWIPMQRTGAAECLGVSKEEMHAQMLLRTNTGNVVRGLDAWIVLLRSVWWLRPIALILRLPGVHYLAEHFYLWVARNRYRLAGRTQGLVAVSKRHPFLELP